MRLQCVYDSNDFFQVDLACQLRKPLFVHERDAHQELTRILSSRNGRLPSTVVHCFTGTADELKTYLDLGFYIGLTGEINL